MITSYFVMLIYFTLFFLVCQEFTQIFLLKTKRAITALLVFLRFTFLCYADTIHFAFPPAAATGFQFFSVGIYHPINRIIGFVSKTFTNATRILLCSSANFAHFFHFYSLCHFLFLLIEPLIQNFPIYIILLFYVKCKPIFSQFFVKAKATVTHVTVALAFLCLYLCYKTLNIDISMHGCLIIIASFLASLLLFLAFLRILLVFLFLLVFCFLGLYL